MELKRITLPPRNAPGEVTTFYSFESGTARSVALANMAVLLAGRQNATVPVLMIDWDTESPGLHHYFDRGGAGPGLLEYFQACREHLQRLGRGPGSAGDTALARQVLEAVDWELYVERVDESRPLYLMRAGRFDDSYGERADQMDWDGLFSACPALFRCFGEYMAERFRHVLVDARSGRSGAVSICTALLPSSLVGLFTPNQRSLDGLSGVVLRAIEYRCTHEEEQRPLLVYPLASSIDSADCQRRLQWRRGDPQRALPGYQPLLEKLMRQCYGLSRVCLDSYLDEVQLQQTNALFSGEHLSSSAERDADRFSLTRTFDTLLDWMEGGHFPWQSLDEVRLSAAIARARAQGGSAPPISIGLPLAGDLFRLGELYRGQGRQADAIACLDESMQLRQRLEGDAHADTRASRAALAALLREAGRLAEARALHEAQLAQCEAALGSEHPDTLAARSALAATLALLGDFERALQLHERAREQCERLYGPTHVATLDALAGHAQTLQRHDDFTRARMVWERVLEGRERLLGSEHADTLRCKEQLAELMRQMGLTNHALGLQEQVIAARARHAGPDHPATLRALEQLAEILVAKSDIPGVRRVLETLAQARERSLGAEHPDTLSSLLRLASMLSDQGELDTARSMQQQLVHLHERVHGVQDAATVSSKLALATTLSRQGHSLDARKIEASVQNSPAHARASVAGVASVAGAHEAEPAPAPRVSVLDQREGAGVPDVLVHKVAQLQELIDQQSEREAREARALADSLRKSILRRNVAPALRSRGVAMIKQIYRRENDKDALIAFTQDEVSSLQEVLDDMSGGGFAAMQ